MPLREKAQSLPRVLDLHCLPGGRIFQTFGVQISLANPNKKLKGDKKMEKVVETNMTGRIASLYVLYLVCLSQAGEFLTGINAVFFLIPLCGLAFLVLGGRKFHFNRASVARDAVGATEVARF
jgi:hypothetical protein